MSYARNSTSKYYAYIVVVVIHIFGFYLLQTALDQGPDFISQPGIQVMLIHERRPELRIDSPKISIDASAIEKNPGKFDQPELQFIEDESVERPATERLSDTAGAVFDPRLRERVAEERGRPKLSRAKNELVVRNDLHGNQFIEKGDGNCLLAMQKMDSRERGTNYAGVSCGKTDSESMMDNVNRALQLKQLK